jgi:hypothetical protein
LDTSGAPDASAFCRKRSLFDVGPPRRNAVLPGLVWFFRHGRKRSRRRPKVC